MASTEVVVERDRRTPPRSPLAADAKPFMPSTSPLKAAASEAGEDAEKEEEAKESEEEEASDEGEGDREGEGEEEQPVKTFPVFNDQQRSRPSMQVRRRHTDEREREDERERAVFCGALSSANFLAFPPPRGREGT